MGRDLWSAWYNQNESGEKRASDAKAVEKIPAKFRKQTGPDWFSLAWLVNKFKTQPAARWKRAPCDY